MSQHREVFSSSCVVGGPEWGRFREVERFGQSRLNHLCSGEYSPRVRGICLFFYLSGSIWSSGKRAKLECNHCIGHGAFVTIDVNPGIVDPEAPDDALIASSADLIERGLATVRGRYKRKWWKFEHERFMAETSLAIAALKQMPTPIELGRRHSEYLQSIDELRELDQQLGEGKKP